MSLAPLAAQLREACENGASDSDLIEILDQSRLMIVADTLAHSNLLDMLIATAEGPDDFQQEIEAVTVLADTCSECGNSDYDYEDGVSDGTTYVAREVLSALRIPYDGNV